MPWPTSPPAPDHPRKAERELRRQVDSAIGRALVDRDYATKLLADPALAIDAEYSCEPQVPALKAIHAATVEDLASQAMELFSRPGGRAADVELESPSFAA